MASYKVLQDIEAEDKFIGPLTLKQFILASLTAIGLYLSVFFLSRGIWLIAVIFLPFELVTGFLAFPWGRDQPTETWLLAKLRYYFKPRKRIWDQSGIQELVKITVPKKIEQVLTDGLSNNEVKSRLKALADTIDSRGWVIKNVDVNLFTQPAYGAMAQSGSGATDRLVEMSSLPREVPALDITANDDIFSNQVASRLDSQIAESSKTHQQTAVAHMQKTVEKVNRPADAPNNEPPANFWFFDQPSTQATPPGYTTFQTSQVVSKDDNPLPASRRKAEPLDKESEALLNKVHHDKSHSHDTFRNHRNLEPFDPSRPVASAVTGAPAPDILNLAIDSDRKVDSLAREARKNHPESPQPNDDEIVIPLR